MISKIAYIVYSNENVTGGVIKKVIVSIRTWLSLGINCKLFILTSNIHLADDLSLLLKKENFSVYSFNSLGKRIIQFHKLVTDVTQLKPDIVYFRYQLFLPSYLLLSSRIPIVIEVNTNDNIERQLQSKIKFFFNKYSRNLVFKKSAGIVYVSPELPKLIEFSKYKKPYIVLGNSFNTSSIQTLKPTNNKWPQLVFMVGSNQPWQGIDKVHILASLFPKWDFHIIGLENNSDSLPNVKFHGFLRREQYTKIMQKADCAIGTLALHRKKMDSTSALKVLEYLTFGLPIILAYNDINFPKQASYILQLPNIENNIVVHKDKIEKFVLSWLNKRVSRKVVKIFDTFEIEKKRIAFFSKIVYNNDFY